MEDTLRENPAPQAAPQTPFVLILVLMEDTLRVRVFIQVTTTKVLILVLMEDTLRESKVIFVSLFSVLILVLMEDTLRACKNASYAKSFIWS